MHARIGLTWLMIVALLGICLLCQEAVAGQEERSGTMVLAQNQENESSSSEAASEPKEQPTAENAGSEKSPEVNKPSVGPPPPEVYYKLLIERQRLMISSYQQMLKILEAHGNDPLRARKDIQTHLEEREAKLTALFNKYNVSPEEYYRSSRGTDQLEERSKYLDEHPEIRDELARNSTELRELERKVWRIMQSLWVEQPKSANQPPKK